MPVPDPVMPHQKQQPFAHTHALDVPQRMESQVNQGSDAQPGDRHGGGENGAPAAAHRQEVKGLYEHVLRRRSRRIDALPVLLQLTLRSVVGQPLGGSPRELRIAASPVAVRPEGTMLFT
eukprot:9544815-Alexandrium_andersonii.AAC.1